MNDTLVLTDTHKAPTYVVNALCSYGLMLTLTETRKASTYVVMALCSYALM